MSLKSLIVAATALAISIPAIATTTPAFAGDNDTIPPNCLLNPFTHKLECVIWPTCTLDPWTGRMNCPVPPRQVVRSVGATVPSAALVTR